MLLSRANRAVVNDLEHQFKPKALAAAEPAMYRPGCTAAHRRKHTVSLFLSGLPVWVGMLLLVVCPTLIAMSGPILLRRWISHDRLVGNNEIAGFKFATIGVIYSVLLAFAVIVVWEKFNEAEIAVLQEAGAATTLYRLTDGGDSATIATRAALTNYLTLAIDRDWPRMAEGKESRDANDALNALYLAALAADRSRSSVLSGETFKQLDAITQARRTRLRLAAGAVPSVIWLVLSLGAVLTIGFTFFFGAKSLKAQVLMTGILAVLAFMGLYVIVSIDHPFTGPTHVDTEPLQKVLEDFAR